MGFTGNAPAHEGVLVCVQTFQDRTDPSAAEQVPGHQQGHAGLQTRGWGTRSPQPAPGVPPLLPLGRDGVLWVPAAMHGMQSPCLKMNQILIYCRR